MSMYKGTYFFHPPNQLGEVGAVGRLPVRLDDITSDEACDLAHTTYRGWEVSALTGIGVVDTPRPWVVSDDGRSIRRPSAIDPQAEYRSEK